MRQLGAVDLLQVVQDIPHGHAVRVEADDHVVQAAGDPPRALGDQHRLEGAGPVPRHGQRHRPDPGLHRLGDGAVAGVPRVMPGRVVPAVTQVRGQLGLQRPLQHRPHQLAEHRPLAGQPQPPGRVLRPFQQRVQQPVIHQLPQRHPAGPGRAGACPVTTRIIPGHPRHLAAIPHRGIVPRVSPGHGLHRCSPPRFSGCPRPAYDYPVLLLYTPRVIPPTARPGRSWSAGRPRGGLVRAVLAWCGLCGAGRDWRAGERCRREVGRRAGAWRG